MTEANSKKNSRLGNKAKKRVRVVVAIGVELELEEAEEQVKVGKVGEVVGQARAVDEQI